MIPDRYVFAARSSTVAPRNTVERAFQLASSGRFGTVESIRRQLLGEGYPAVHAHLRGLATRRQLKALCDRSRRGSRSDSPPRA